MVAYRHISVAVAILVFLVGSASAQQPATPPAQVRTWTDITGQYKVEAAFVSFANGQVTLRRKDGQLAVFPLARLSAADQKVVAELLKPPAPVLKPDPLPLLPLTLLETPPLVDASRELMPSPELKPPVTMRSLGKKIAIPPGPVVWRVQPDGVAVYFKPTAEPILGPKPKKGYFGGGSHWSYFKPRDKAELWYGRVSFPSGDKELDKLSLSYVERMDMAGGKSLGCYVLPTGCHFGAISPTAKRAAIGPENDRTYSFLQRFKRIDIFEIAGPTWNYLYSFEPYSDLREGSDVRTRYVHFVDDRYLLICRDGSDYIRLYDLQEKTLVWEIEGGFGMAGKFTLSNGGRFLFVNSREKEITAIDVLRGEVAGKLPGKWDHNAGALPLNLEFHPQGTHLAVFKNKHVTIFDLKTGLTTSDIDLPSDIFQGGGGDIIGWVDDRYLITGGFVIDLQLKELVWQYSGHQVGMIGGVLINQVIQKSGDTGIVAIHLPTTEDLTILQKITPANAAALPRVKREDYGGAPVFGYSDIQRLMRNYPKLTDPPPPRVTIDLSKLPGQP